MDEHKLRRSDRRSEGRAPEPPRFRADDGRARADRAHGGPDAGVGRCRARPDEADVHATKRGGGGALKVLWWQGATLLNPHFAVGTKDQDGSRIFYEPLASFDPDGNLVPDPGRRDPERAERRLGKDGRSVTWKLKKGVTWHDGKPFTADDVVFNWEYAADPATAATTIGSYKDIERIDKIDSHTVKITFKKPTALLGRRLLRQPRHDHPQAPLRGLQGRQVARGAGQPQAGGHRPLQVRRLQAGRHRPGRAQSELPHAEPALLRHPRDEGRRRRGLGGPGRHPDRRVRLRLEHAGRGRDPQAHGAGRQGQGRHRGWRQHRAHPVQPDRSVEGGRRRAVEPQDARIPSSPTPPCARPSTSSSIARAIQEQIYGRIGHRHRQLPERAVPLPVQEHQVGVQRRQGQPDPRGGRLEARARTASGPRTARSSRWSTRPPSTPRARRPRPSSSRPRPRRGSTWS